MIFVDLTYAAFITPWTLAMLSDRFISSRWVMHAPLWSLGPWTGASPTRCVFLEAMAVWAAHRHARRRLHSQLPHTRCCCRGLHDQAVHGRWATCGPSSRHHGCVCLHGVLGGHVPPAQQQVSEHLSAHSAHMWYVCLPQLRCAPASSCVPSPVSYLPRPMYILDVAMGVLYVFDLLLKLHLACVIQFGYYKVLITNGPGILRIYAMEVRG